MELVAPAGACGDINEVSTASSSAAAATRPLTPQPLGVDPATAETLPVLPPSVVIAAAPATAPPETGVPATEAPAPLPQPSVYDFIKHRIQSLSEKPEVDFDGWISLLKQIEDSYLNDVQAIRLVYDKFLSEFPLCFGYWNKYAVHMSRLCSYKEIEEVLERGIQAATFCVDLWVIYCDFAIRAYEDPTAVRRLFERALAAVGKDYTCYRLWDKYIEYEYTQKEWNRLADIYLDTLNFPSKKLHDYFESFKKLIITLKEDLAQQGSNMVETPNLHDGAITDQDTKVSDQHKSHPAPDAISKYLLAGESNYHKSREINKEITHYEVNIRRHFFDMKPLDDQQLENWSRYLDFVDKQLDFDWAVKLYERCLIPCANYSEFWIRYVDYADSKGGRELAIHALNRASSTFLKWEPTFRRYCALFKEKIDEKPGARSLLLQEGTDNTLNFIQHINKMANMEKRMGNTEVAFGIYEDTIRRCIEKHELQFVPDLYANFAKFKFVVSASLDDAKEVFMDGLQRVPCKYLLKELMQFMSIQGGSSMISNIDNIIEDAIIPKSDIWRILSAEEREEISLSYMEFVDFHGGSDEIRKVFVRHCKLFPSKTRNFLQFMRGNSSAPRSYEIGASNGSESKQSFDENQVLGENKETKEGEVYGGIEHLVLHSSQMTLNANNASDNVNHLGTSPELKLHEVSVCHEPNNHHASSQNINNNRSNPAISCDIDKPNPVESLCSGGKKATSFGTDKTFNALAGQSSQPIGSTLPQSRPPMAGSQSEADAYSSLCQYWQNVQAYAPQLWQSYQQQLLYFYQHQQMQNNQHQQQHQSDQQFLLWQQLQQQQQQGKDQNLQQAAQIDQNQSHPQLSPMDSAQDAQDREGQEAYQIQHHSQQSQPEQQEEQQQQQQQLLIYYNQQQQYLMQQQQQLYQQHLILHQQLVQQKEHPENPEQQHDMLQKQQLFQQQQQQLHLLQHQQQQLYQLQLHLMQQQQINPQALQAFNYNIYSQYGSSNQQLPLKQEGEALQVDGPTLQNADQSGSPHPSSPKLHQTKQQIK